ncbi:MAG TPA: isochorismatase family cysteine hydrolase [Chthoniobacterales bacterium]|nr:isochorismatase family cysteine hydrolase [Chthoniobacterales bacterium]
MPAKNEDLHGSAPDKCETALLLIDVINDLAFPEAEEMLPLARTMADKLLALKQRAREAGVPSIYVNDNFGKWKSDFRSTVDHCLSTDSRGREIVETLRPDDDDYFVLKPKHSGFFSTTLETLLHYVGAKRLILTGIAGNFCVLFTANDAYMRDFNLMIPADCCVSNTPRENDEALALMRKFLKADTRPSDQIELRDGTNADERRTRKS